MAKTAADLAGGLDSNFSGEVLVPSDPDYETARRIHNGLIDKRPALIARCRTIDDVAAAVNLGRSEGLEISVRGGGHNVAGRAVTNGGLMIDLSPMKQVTVDPEARTARAEPGVIWREYNDATAEHGLASTGGVISTTGVAGLTLGGGLGWLMGTRGLSIDNLISADVVLASGETVVASEATDPDLFWAIRGGGGNFGVVTSFTYNVHPLETVLGGLVAHPLERAPDVFAFHSSIKSDLPDELMTTLALVHAPDGSGMKICGVAMCESSDDHDQAERNARPLREFGPPVLDMVDRMPYPVANTLLDDGFQKGSLNYWKAGRFPDVSEEVAGVLVDAFSKSPTIMCGMIVEHVHGAATRVAPTATAYPHRNAGYNAVLISQWTDATQTDECISWTRSTYDALRPFMDDSVYVNYLDADDDGRIRSAYGPNFERLVQLKRRYDPDNLFRLNHNIDPAAG
ncbi:MAG: FAD-binding oxidoreductase [Actinomycetota bacterium]